MIKINIQSSLEIGVNYLSIVKQRFGLYEFIDSLLKYEESYMEKDRKSFVYFHLLDSEHELVHVVGCSMYPVSKGLGVFEVIGCEFRGRLFYVVHDCFDFSYSDTMYIYISDDCLGPIGSVRWVS